MGRINHIVKWIAIGNRPLRPGYSAWAGNSSACQLSDMQPASNATRHQRCGRIYRELRGNLLMVCQRSPERARRSLTQGVGFELMSLSGTSHQLQTLLPGDRRGRQLEIAGTM